MSRRETDITKISSAFSHNQCWASAKFGKDAAFILPKDIFITEVKKRPKCINRFISENMYFQISEGKVEFVVKFIGFL